MEPTSISLLCPTIGRASLATLIITVRDQLAPEDEFLVIGDGPQPDGAAIVAAAGHPRIRYLETPEFKGDWGATPLDFGTIHATGDYLMYIGDDDTLTPGSLGFVRKIADAVDKHPYIFAMNYTGFVLKGSMKVCECSGQQFVIPNDPERLPAWSDDGDEANDWTFLQKTLALWDGRVEFRDEVIATLIRRSHGSR